jgi:hypothetical protein
MRKALMLMVLVLACSRRSDPEPTPTPVRTQPATRAAARPPSSAATTARTVVGAYQFTAVNKARVPAEFPAGSGARLESGTLELQSNNRFAMRFQSRAPGAADVRSSGEDGRYRIGRDTLYFYVDGRETQPPVTFRFVRTSDGLRLIDSKGNNWIYVRR